jgi:hypothetical protein
MNLVGIYKSRTRNIINFYFGDEKTELRLHELSNILSKPSPVTTQFFSVHIAKNCQIYHSDNPGKSIMLEEILSDTVTVTVTVVRNIVDGSNKGWKLYAKKITNHITGR